MSTTAATNYRRNLHRQANFPYSLNETAGILTCIRDPHFEVEVPDFVLRYLTAYIIEYYEEIEFKTIATEETMLVADTGLFLFSWTTPSSSPKALFLTPDQSQYISNHLVQFNAGLMPDDVSEISRVLLEEDTESLEANRVFLTFLGLINAQSTEDNSEVDQIPTPSDTLTIDESTARFSSAIWFEEIQKKNIILAGLGGIGSYVAFLLGRMHPNNLFLYDDDKVEAVNMSGQLFCVNDIGRYKVDAVTHTLATYCSFNKVCAIRERFTPTTEPSDIMICGFDNMAARKIFYERWLYHLHRGNPERRKQCLFIDGRLAAEELQVFCIRGDDAYNIDRYREEFLFSDEEADATECSYKQTTYMANMIGSVIVNLFTNFVANSIEENLRDLPFLTSYSADSMMFKTEQ